MASNQGDNNSSHLKLSKVKDFVSSKFTGRGHHRTPSSSAKDAIPTPLPSAHSEPILESKPTVNIPLETNIAPDSVTNKPSTTQSSTAPPPPEKSSLLHKLIPEIKTSSSNIATATSSISTTSQTGNVSNTSSDSKATSLRSSGEEKWTNRTAHTDATPHSRKVSVRAGSVIGQRNLFSRVSNSGSFIARGNGASNTTGSPNVVGQTTKREFDPKEFFDTVARALVSPSEPLYLFFFLVLLLFLLVASQFFGVFLVWGTTLLLLYIIAMHQSQESRAEFFKEFINFFPRENATQQRPQALEELEWLNNMLHQAWVGFVPDLTTKFLLSRAHLVIDKALPNALKKLDTQVQLKEIKFGTTPPLVTQLSFDKMDPRRPNRMTLNVTAKWVSGDDSYLLLDVGYMSLHWPVRVESFVANLQLRITIIVDGKDIDETVIQMSIMNQGGIEMPNIKPLGMVPDVLILPIRKWVNTIVSQNINELLGYPQSLRFSLRELALDSVEEDPITDIQVVFPDTEKDIPGDYILLGKTVTGYPANLNSGRVGAQSVYLCFRCSKTEKPITDVAIIFRDPYKQKLGEAVPPDFECVTKTLVNGYPANINAGSDGREIYIAYKRGDGKPITKLGILFVDRDEEAPPGFETVTHTFSGQWKANLNAGDKSARRVYLCYKGGNASLRNAENTNEPITDLALLNVDLDEKIPDFFSCLETSISGAYAANLNSKHTLTKFNPLNLYKQRAETYLCYRRGGKMDPITDIGIVALDKKDPEKTELNALASAGWVLLDKSASGFSGDLNRRETSAAKEIFIAFKREKGAAPIKEIGVWFKGKELDPPKHYTIVDKSIVGARADLSSALFAREVYICFASEGRMVDAKPAQNQFSESISGTTKDGIPVLEEQGTFSRFVTGVVKQKDRVAGKIRGVVSLGERADKGKADLSEKDKQGIVQIVQGGDIQKLKERLKELDVDSLSGISLPSNAPYMSVGGSWLHVASTSKNAAQMLVALDIDNGEFDVNGVSEMGWTPLHLAAYEGNLEACNVLLNNGASPSKANPNDAVLPIHFFVLHNYNDKIHNIKDTIMFYSVFDRLLKGGKLVDKATHMGETALHFAIKKEGNNGENAIFLLYNGAEANVSDKKGNTPLKLALAMKKKEVIMKLLEAGADFSPELLTQHVKQSPEYSLLAAKFGRVEGDETRSKEDILHEIFDSLCKGDAFLLRRFLNLLPQLPSMNDIAKPPTFQSDKRTWLHLAAYEGNVGVVKILSKLPDAPFNQSSIFGRTPLHEAASAGQWPVMIELIRSGANPSLKASPEDDLALHFASSQKIKPSANFVEQYELVCAINLLTDHTSLVNQSNSRGATPLHYCRKNGNVPNAMVLLSLGADPAIPDKQGKTALDCAVKNGKSALIAFFSGVVDETKTQGEGEEVSNSSNRMFNGGLRISSILKKTRYFGDN